MELENEFTFIVSDAIRSENKRLDFNDQSEQDELQSWEEGFLAGYTATTEV